VFQKHKARESALELLFASGLSKMTACIQTHLPSRRKVRSKSVCSALMPHGARHPTCSLTALWRFSCSHQRVFFTKHNATVIRSRMMDARTQVGFVETCRQIYLGEGVAGFYAGSPITSYVSFPIPASPLSRTREQLEHSSSSSTGMQ
jgi:hypothetical protein